MKSINCCENNDVFAYKIENYKGYNGRYLILIRYISEYYNNLYELEHSRYRKEDLFLYRCKITIDDKLPRSYEELENLPYIKTEMITFYERYMPLSGRMTYEELVDSRSYAKFYPDEYNYLYGYLLGILDGEDFRYRIKGLKKYLYLGNFELTPPKEEYFPFSIGSGMKYELFKDIPQTLIQSYDDYNLKKSKCYSKDENYNILKASKKNMKIALEIEEISRNIMKDQAYQEYILSNSKMNAWSSGLYSSDIALDVRDDYIDYMKEEKRENKSHVETIEEFKAYYKEYIADELDGPVFWIILANEEMKRKLLTSDVKNKALEAIEKDLPHWEDRYDYKDRKIILEKFRKKLETYNIEE